MRIVVVGSGAIGSYYGGKLQQGDAEIALFCRSDYETVKNHGIYVKSISGDFHFKPQKVIKSLNELPWEPDYVLVCLKVLPNVNTSELIKPAVCKNTAICLIQNGIDIEPPVARAFPGNELISGLAFICCQRTQSGVVEHLDYGRLVLGNYPEGVSKRTYQLADLFNRSGVACDVTDDVVKARWQKLVWNAPFNPISVLAGGVTTQEMLADARMEETVRAVMREVCLLAEADGHPLPENVIEENISFTRAMTPYKTSMLLDFENKRPMEVDAILGNAVKKAEKLGIEVPHLKTLYSLLSMVDRKNSHPNPPSRARLW